MKYECYVPAGEFIMGDDKGDSDEKPAHRVTLDAFYIGKYPVTNAEYARYMAERICASRLRCRPARKTIRWSRSAGTTPRLRSVGGHAAADGGGVGEGGELGVGRQGNW